MKPRRVLFFLLLFSAVGFAVSAVLKRQILPPAERRAEPDPDALRSGAVADRIGLDVSRLHELNMTPYKPLVQYLTAIQVQRGDQETLLFVRQRDLDALAALAGEEKEEFLENFRQLGVLLSMN